MSGWSKIKGSFSISLSMALLIAVLLGPIDIVTMDARADWTAEVEFSPKTIYSGEMFHFAINYTNIGSSTVTIHYANGEVDWGTEVQKFYSLMGLERTLDPGETLILDPAIISPTPDVPSGTYAMDFTVGGTNPGDILITQKRYSCDFELVRAPPIENVSINASILSGEAPLTVDFSVSADGGIAGSIYCSWIFGDDNKSHSETGWSAQHTYSEPGTYQVIAWVTDRTNHAVNATVDIVVGPKAAATNSSGSVDLPEDIGPPTISDSSGSSDPSGNVNNAGVIELAPIAAVVLAIALTAGLIIVKGRFR